MTLMAGISLAEELLGRPLTPDETVMVAQLVERGAPAEEIIKVFDGFERPPDVDEDDVPINRYVQAVDEQGQIVATRV